MIGLQALANTASRLLAVSLLFVATIIVARALGPEGNGHYTVAITFSAMVTQFANLGLHVGNIYQLAQDPKRLAPIVGNSLLISVVLGGLSAACSVLILLAAGQVSAAELSFLWLGAAMAPCRLFFTLGGNIYVGLNKMRLFNIFAVLNYLLVLTGVIAAFCWDARIESFLWGVLAGWLVTCSLLVWQLLSMINYRLEFSWSLFKEGFLYATRAYIVCLLGF
ncbi:MAG: oligosaccharide flippase family protein [Planctomycetales bacterium]